MNIKEIEELIEKWHKKEREKEYKEQIKFLIQENEKLKRLLAINEKLNEIKVVPINYTKSKGQDNGCLIALLSDIHIEKHISKTSTNNINEFNLDIARKRLERYFINLVKIHEKHNRDIKLDTLLFGWLGDFIHGLIHEEYMKTNLLTPPEAVIFAVEILTSGLEYLLNYKKIKEIIIVCKVGNHSRITERIFNDEEAIFSYEWVIYNTLKNKFPMIKWILENNYLTYVNIANKTIRFHHGHQVKYYGGIGGIYIPINKYRLRIDQHIRADLNCIGHFHSSDWMRNAKTLLNGSVCGFDAYTLRKGYEPEPPMQQTLILDYKRGFTINTPILLEQ